MEKRLLKVFLLLLLPALVILSFPDLYVIAIVTIVGIVFVPFFYAIIFAEIVCFGTIFFSFFIGRMFWNSEDEASQRSRIFIGLSLTILTMVGIPFFVNKSTNEKLNQFNAQNINLIDNYPLGTRIAIVNNARRYNGSQAICDGMCVRLLYSGRFTEVIVLEDYPNTNIAPSEEYRSFHIENRTNCPLIDIQDNDVGSLKRSYDNENVKNEPSISPEKFALGKVAQNQCIVERKTKLQNGDTIIFDNVGQISQRRNKFDIAFYRTRSALAYRIIDDKFLKIYQFSEAEHYPLAPILMIVPSYSGMSASNSLWRVSDKSSNKVKNDDKRSLLVATLIDKMGINLELPDINIDYMEEKNVDKFINNTNYNENSQKIAENYLETLTNRETTISYRYSKYSEEELSRVFKIYINPNINVPDQMSVFVAHVKRDETDFFEKMANASFTKLEKYNQNFSGDKYKAKSEISEIAMIFNQMPDDIIIKHQNEFVKTLEKPKIMFGFKQLLPKFALFGDAAKPMALNLIDNGLMVSKYSKNLDVFDESARETAYSALNIICLLSDKSDIKMKNEIVNRVMDNPEFNSQSVAITLYQLGASRGEIVSVLKWQDKTEEQNHFDVKINYNGKKRKEEICNF
ncbi:MAG: hypothetical protein J0L55_05590 [Caulobacterales bacterium]|nr:hypothetical protein [Caulobacterales bacterium]MCA0372589.1 hypothetical protein [Pseudomonadota bacterium]